MLPLPEGVWLSEMKVVITGESPMAEAVNVIRRSISAHVGWLEFDRPPVNAFTREMVEDVHEAIAAMLAEPQARVVVLASAVERYFSAGEPISTSSRA